jgi:hypothetical protein
MQRKSRETSRPLKLNDGLVSSKNPTGPTPPATSTQRAKAPAKNGLVAAPIVVIGDENKDPEPAVLTPLRPARPAAAVRGLKPRRPTPSKSGNVAGRKPGVQNYSRRDSNALLDPIEAILPASATEWGSVREVYTDYCDANERQERTVESLRDHFKKMVNTPKRTGDPDCPPKIVRAKRAHYKIVARLEMATLDKPDSDEEGEDPDEDDSRNYFQINAEGRA